jgi:hypothetical protein
LSIDATFTELVGRRQGVPVRGYPQAIAVALALRHSWRREDLMKFARRLGVKLTAKDLREVAVPDNSDESASADDAGLSEASIH